MRVSPRRAGTICEVPMAARGEKFPLPAVPLGACGVLHWHLGLQLDERDPERSVQVLVYLHDQLGIISVHDLDVFGGISNDVLSLRLEEV